MQGYYQYFGLRLCLPKLGGVRRRVQWLWQQALRRRGITIRRTIDLLIGTWCIENGRPLLHNDSDFHPMARHLGLVEVAVASP